MKITDPDVIKNGERDLIESVKDDLDLDVVKKILEKRLAAASLSSKGGEIIVHNNQIAFRMDFDIHLSGSLMFDRQGNYIAESLETPEDEKTISQEYDLDDIDMSLEEIKSQTIIDTTENDSIDNPEGEPEDLVDDETFGEELDIDLPDYGMDDDSDMDDESEPDDSSKPENDESKNTGEMNIELMDKDIDTPLDIDDLDPLTDVTDIDDPNLFMEETDLDDPDSLTEETDLDDLDSLSEETDLDDLDPLADDLPGGENDLIDSDAPEDDMNDILKESREFWEQKKES